jgi:hypothetical protein
MVDNKTTKRGVLWLENTIIQVFLKKQLQAETDRFKTQYNYLFDALGLKQKDDLTLVSA